ncbi:prepilin-type N-terminal cleavage/methylation domain-containing protein [Ruminococcus sp. AM42-11]|uniref:prepilin-type N-terminal cleavage/methylation domain-containing protein n=1 Tax=Ruminococcus sp. AM42-11 TaxID=2292372 RepID=UPI001A9ACC0F|nr:prepilin-type N-terminal cleavage/methylation domain-containing protein [Ruminococcus sp. AM42-11]
MKYRSKKGFTLAELLIVVAIIAVLVAVSSRFLMDSWKKHAGQWICKMRELLSRH